MKLPVLLHHLRHHEQEHDASGIVDFLIDHYAIENGSDDDAADDRQLPFKSTDAIVSGTFIAIAPPELMCISSLKAQVITRTFKLLNDQEPANNFGHNIWQPPRHC